MRHPENVCGGGDVELGLVKMLEFPRNLIN